MQWNILSCVPLPYMQRGDPCLIWFDHPTLSGDGCLDRERDGEMHVWILDTVMTWMDNGMYG